MGRRSGSRNADFETSRQALIRKITPKANASSSFRELAATAEVSTATLRHYFADREGVLHEVLAHQRAMGAPYMHAAATAEVGTVRESLSWLLHTIANGWSMGLGGVHALGLGAGLGDPRVGPSYVNEVLEPTLQSVEARIQKHIDSNELAPTNVRFAALSLLSPLVLGLLHQQGLFGSKCRPLDLSAFVDDHVEHFLKAYGAPPAPAESSRHAKRARRTD